MGLINQLITGGPHIVAILRRDLAFSPCSFRSFLGRLGPSCPPTGPRWPTLRCALLLWQRHPGDLKDWIEHYSEGLPFRLLTLSLGPSEVQTMSDLACEGSLQFWIELISHHFVHCFVALPPRAMWKLGGVSECTRHRELCLNPCRSPFQPWCSVSKASAICSGMADKFGR